MHNDLHPSDSPSHPTRMATEIRQQPAVLAATLDALLPNVAVLRSLARDRTHIMFVARGSSTNAAVYGRYVCELHGGRPSALASPSIATQYRHRLDLSDTLVVGLSQSGRTAEITQTMGWARTCRAATVAVTNAAGSPLASSVDIALITRAGEERAVPATKTYTAQLAALAVLGVALAPAGDVISRQLSRVPDEMYRVLSQDHTVAAAARLFLDRPHAVVTSRGYALSTAQELSLKLLETCRLPSLGLSYADLLHGPVALVGQDTAAIVIAPPDGPMRTPPGEIATQLRARGAAVVGIGGDDAFALGCHVALARTTLPEALAPLVLVGPGQQLVEELARRMGHDPDAPRGLSKITQTDTRQIERSPSKRCRPSRKYPS